MGRHKCSMWLKAASKGTALGIHSRAVGCARYDEGDYQGRASGVKRGQRQAIGRLPTHFHISARPCRFSSLSFNCNLYIIQHCELPDAQRASIVALVGESCEQYNDNNQLASQTIKERLDELYGPSWHVVVGRRQYWEPFTMHKHNISQASNSAWRSRTNSARCSIYSTAATRPCAYGAAPKCAHL